MRLLRKSVLTIFGLLILFGGGIGGGGCSGMSTRNISTAVGGVAGSVHTGGSSVGTIGGAAIGGNH